MKRQQIKGAASILFMTLFLFTSCQKNNHKINSRLPQEEKNEATAPAQKIAYIEIDSINTQYEFCKEYTKILTQKSERMRAELNSKGNSLQKAAAEFQQKASQGAYTEETGKQAQTNLQKQQANLQSLQERYSEELEKETNKFNSALRDSLQNFLADYNKTHGYSLILSKAGDNILMAAKSMDITNDVISGLNKRYKKSHK